MPLQFRELFNRNPGSRFTAAQAVEHVIETAPDYYDGELESLQRKQDKIIEIIGKVVAVLPPDLQRQLVESLHMFEEVCDG